MIRTAAAAISLLAAPVAADFFSLDASRDTLVRVAMNGGITEVGSLGVDVDFAALAFDGPALFGLLRTADDRLVIAEIDQATGLVRNQNELSFDRSRIVAAEGLAFDGATGGLVIAFTRAGSSPVSNQLGRLDPTTGEIRPLATFSFGTDIDGLVGVGGGEFFASDRVPSPGFNSFFSIVEGDATRYDIDPIASLLFTDDVNGLSDFAFDGDSVWAPDFITRRLVEIDPDTAAIRSVTPYSGDLRGLAFIPGPGAAGAWIVAGAACLRRRR